MPEMFGKIGRRITRLSSIWGSGNFQCINLAERRVYIDDPSRATIGPSRKTNEPSRTMNKQQTNNEQSFMNNERSFTNNERAFTKNERTNYERSFTNNDRTTNEPSRATQNSNLQIDLSDPKIVASKLLKMHTKVYI